MLPDFENIDKKFEFHFYEEQKTIAKNLGYIFISEAYFDLKYKQGLSFRTISQIFGFSSQNTIIYFFKKHSWKYPSYHEKQENSDPESLKDSQKNHK